LITSLPQNIDEFITDAIGLGAGTDEDAIKGGDIL